MPPPEDGPDGEPGVGPTPAPRRTGPEVLRIGITSLPTADPRGLDSPDALLLASQVFDGLVAYEPGSMEVVPAVAESWRVRERGRRFVFRLRSDALFHDGSPVGASDFVRAWTRLVDPFRPSPYAFLLERVEGFRAFNETLEAGRITGLSAPDERTLEVRLEVPWPGFVAVLGHPALSPVPEAAELPGYAAQPIGNGPYLLASQLTPGAPISLQAFGDYYGTPPAVPAAEFVVFPDPGAAWPHFLAGELEVSPIPAALVPEAEAEFGTQGIVALARLVHCGFNLQDARFRDVRLRRAVALALDRETLTERVYGTLAAPATGIVPQTIPGSVEDACGALCRQDMERAAALVRGLPDRERSFALDYAASPVGDELAAELAAQLEAVGLRARPRPHDEEEYAALLERGDHQFFCLVSVADYPRQQALLEPMLHSESPDNHTGPASPRLDRLLDQARAALSDDTERERYLEAERLGLSLAPVVPLSWFRSRLAAPRDVGGLAVDPLGLFDVSALSLAP